MCYCKTFNKRKKLMLYRFSIYTNYTIVNNANQVLFNLKSVVCCGYETAFNLSDVNGVECGKFHRIYGGILREMGTTTDIFTMTCKEIVLYYI